jgi:hypothetical protein
MEREGLMSSFRIATLTTASLVLATACMNDGDGGGDQSPCRTFSTALSVKDRMSQSVDVFNVGEPIGFELQTTNTTNAPATLTAASSCMAVVFEVFDSANERRWGSADGIACFAALQPRTYAPLETVAQSASWNQNDSNGAPVAPGRYTVTASVGQYASDSTGLVDCRAPLSKTATLTIQ